LAQFFGFLAEIPAQPEMTAPTSGRDDAERIVF
jgi:hypothetical protein